MRYRIKSNDFVSKRCRLDLNSMEAWSYDWWQFVAVVGRTVYFNHANYSMQTGKQQQIVGDILKDLGVETKPVWIRSGLQNIKGEISNLNYEIRTLEELIANPRSRAKTNKDRLKQIKAIKARIVKLEHFDKLMQRGGKYSLPFRAHDRLRDIAEEQRAKQRAKRPLRKAAPLAPKTETFGFAWPTLVRGGL